MAVMAGLLAEYILLQGLLTNVTPHTSYDYFSLYKVRNITLSWMQLCGGWWVVGALNVCNSKKWIIDPFQWYVRTEDWFPIPFIGPHKYCGWDAWA